MVNTQANSAYTQSDTPTIRRIFQHKGHLTPLQQTENAAMKTIRVRIEQYFGRLKFSWKFLHQTYPRSF